MRLPVQRLDLGDWFSNSVEPYLGFQPTSTSPQPVHVLNGFMHARLTGRRSIRAASTLVATKDGRWARSEAEARTVSPAALPQDSRELDALRVALAGLIAADGAVFMGNIASFQLASTVLVSSDRTHLGIGSLGAHLLSRASGGDESFARLVTRLRETQRNPFWALEELLRGTDEEFEPRPPETPVPGWMSHPACAPLADSLAGLIQRSVDLAAEGSDSLLGLQLLATSLTWTALVVYAQVPSLVIGRGKNALLCEGGEPGALPGVRSASASVVTGLTGAFEAWMTERLREEVNRRYPQTPVLDDEAKLLLEATAPYRLSGGVARTQERLLAVYDVWRDHEEAPAALAHTLCDYLSAGLGNRPAKWFSAVGRHCGFVGPRRGRTARLRMEVNLAPALVIAAVDDSDASTVPFKVVLERLGDRYGVVFGPSALTGRIVQKPPEEELQRNVVNAAATLTQLGLARRYSDRVTEMLNPLKVWL